VLIGTVLVLAAAAGSAAGAVFTSRDGQATVALSSTAAGARSVAVTVQLPAVLQCGRPMGGPVSVSLPQGERMPRAIGTSAVRVNGITPASVTVSGRTVTETLPVRHGVTCMTLIDGRMKLVLAPAAGLGNPSAAGSYTVVVRQGKTGWLVPVSIGR
jgi:hypothetical protein